MHRARIIVAATLALAVVAPQAAFADEQRSGISNAADALRGELSAALSTYDQAKSLQSKLNGQDISAARVQGLQDVSYDGTEQRPTVTLKMNAVKDGKVTEKSLREGEDFDVSFDGDLVNPGTVNVTITGKGEYTGTVQTSFVITQADLSHATVDVITDRKRTGEAIEPDVVVKLDGRELTRGVDYTVAYSNNVDEGTAGIAISGIGNCTGETHATFQIVENPREGTRGYRAVLPYVAAAAGVCAVALVALGIVAIHKRRKAKRNTRK